MKSDHATEHRRLEQKMHVRPVVLAVDDVAANLLALEGMLRRDDVDLVTANSGQEALEILLERDVAVAIIDVMMPEMDGFELAELIRNVDRTRRVPIIFVTAGSQADYRVFTGYETGAIDFLFKPINPHVLRAKVDVLVSLEQQRLEAARARAETEVLLRFTRLTSRCERPDEIYEPALDAMRDLLGAERSAILLYDDSGRMRFRAWRGLSDAYRAAMDGHSPWRREAKDPRPILIADVAKDESMTSYRSIVDAEGIGAIGFVPLVSGQVLGKFMLYWDQPRTFSEHDEALVVALASQLAETLTRARLREAERAAHERRAAIQMVSDAALAHLDITPLLAEMLARVRRVFRCDTATVLMLSADRRRLEVRASDGIERQVWDLVGVPYGAGIAGAVVAEKRSVVVNDVAAANVVSPILKQRLASMMGSPLVVERDAIGVVHVGCFERREFSEEDVELLQMVAARIAMAIDRASAYEALRVAEEKLRVALTAGRMGVWEWSVPDGRVTWSETLEVIHGLEPGTFPGTIEAYQSDIHPDDKQELLRTIQETLEAGRDHHIEYRIIRPDGQVRWVAGHGNVVSRADGKPVTLMGVCLDITDQKQAEQALRDSETRYRTLFEVSVYGVITIDEDGVIETANKAAERLFGYSVAEMTGRNITMLMPEPFRGEHGSYLQNYLRTGERKVIGIGREVIGKRRDGSQFPMDLAVSEFRVGQRRFFKGVVSDITERKQLEQAREAALTELKQTLHDNEMFAGVLAHDLRNPLSAIITATRTVLRRHSEQTDPTLSPLKRVISGGDRMTRMIDQLLDFTRARVGGGFELALAEVDLAELCVHIVDEIEVAYPKWKVKMESAGDLKGAWDRDRLNQVLSNLVTNAGLHGRSGSEILVKLDGIERDFVSLEVHNMGAIRESVRPKLFSPFLGTRERSYGGGLGLGVYIMKEILHSHGGTVEVDSSEASGTTFRVRLPRRPSRENPQDS